MKKVFFIFWGFSKLVSAAVAWSCEVNLVFQSQSGNGSLEWITHPLFAVSFWTKFITYSSY